VVQFVTRWLTSSQLAALKVPFHDAGTGLTGRSFGQCHRGGAFRYDPFSAYRAGLVSSPNVLVTGAIGVGKSTVVKMLVARGCDLGYGSVILDPKGEYADVATHHDGRVVALGPGGRSWCNPFSGERREDLALVETMVATALGRGLGDDERFALEAGWDERDAAAARRPLQALFAHFESTLTSSDPSIERSLAYTLRRFVLGDLAGLFDGDSLPDDLDSSVVVLDLSSVWQSESMALVGLAAMAVARRALARRATPGYLVVDEAWAVLAEPRVAHWLHGSWKLARAHATSHVLVLHRWSDAFAAADDGTAQRTKVLGILRDCDTTFLFRQDAGERALLDDVLGLHPLERSYVVSLPRGVSLVRYGPHRSIVRVEPDDRDRLVIDTDAAMRAES
jgi:type IV secretory pathway VirB4 component